MSDILTFIREYIISHKVDYPVEPLSVVPTEIIAAINSQFLTEGLEAFVNPPYDDTGRSTPTLAYIFFVTRDGKVWCQCNNGKNEYDITTLLGNSLENIREAIEKRIEKLEKGRL